MNLKQILSQFSKNRLDGEPVPDDLKALLAHRQEFLRRTGLELQWKKDWAPWLDTSYLRPAELADPDIAANLRAIREVCELIAFIAADEDGNYFGYWRGPQRRPVAGSPLVQLDNEGQFRLLPGGSLAEATLADWASVPERLDEFRDWLRSAGVPFREDVPEEATVPEEETRPGELHEELYYRYLAKPPES